MLLNTLLSWFYLYLTFMLLPEKWKGIKNLGRGSITNPTPKVCPDPSVIRNVLRTSYQELGQISEHETTVSVCSGVGLLVWILHDPKFVPGWSQLFSGGSKNVSIATATILVGLCFLVFPRNLRQVLKTGI